VVLNDRALAPFPILVKHPSIRISRSSVAQILETFDVDHCGDSDGARVKFMRELLDVLRELARGEKRVRAGAPLS
jgi:hypothetical protein